MTESELEQLITKAKIEGWTELDLSGQYLTSLPQAIYTLQKLQVLKLGWNKTTKSRNYFTDLPKGLAQLTNLYWLDLSGNSLPELPEELAQLTNLHYLDLSRNNLTELPSWLANLINLQSLNLSGNEIRDLPKELARLVNLRALYLEENALRELPGWLVNLTNLNSLYLSENDLIELPDWLGQLANLQVLHLSYTNLTELPESLAQLTGLYSLDLNGNDLEELPKWLANLNNLQSLYLSSNSLEKLPKSLARLTNLKSLYLGSNPLTELPEWLAQLTNLRDLDLSYTILTELPEWLIRLPNLQLLDLSSTSLVEIPGEIAQLTNLQSLFVSDNELTDLPEALKSLVNLQSLDLSENMLTTLPDWLVQLKKLSFLDLSDNDLTEIPEALINLISLESLNLSGNNLTKVPEWLAQLTNLHYLNLRGNKLTNLTEKLAQLNILHTLDLGENKLVMLPEELMYPGKLPKLRNLYLGRNPLVMPPAELLEEALTKNYYAADIDAIRSYFRQLREAATVYFYEAKVLIIGEGGAGKTSLARKLIEPDCQLLPNEQSTEGIVIRNWEFPLPQAMTTDKDNHYTANLWDFGGQEIYFATHQFFLTRRSVYLLVADTRRQHTDFYTWLRMQETFGEDSPVLLVKNRNRLHGNSFTIENLPQLRERFPNLQEIIEVDLQEAPSDQGWQDLLYHLQHYLLTLPHIGQPRPSTWVAVRTAIDHDVRDIIPWPAFITLCQEQGMKQEEDMAQLAEYLHNLGDILYFHNDPILRDYVILKPTWGLDAVYKVLDNPAIEAQLGQFSFQELRSLWRDPIYTGYHLHLLRLMENFQLCYPLPDLRDNYIAPQLLTQEIPTYDWDEQENLQLRYAYPVFMPRGILSRATVKLHQRIEVQRLVWRAGVILNDGYARAEILELRGEQQIRIRVSGRNKRDLLMEIVRALDDLHRGFPKLHFERLVPCICDTCRQRREPHFFDLAILLERLAYRKETIECRYPHYTDVPIQSLLSEISLWGHQFNLPGDTFISNYYGDHIEVGDISDATGIALGRRSAATVRSKR